MMGCGVSVVKCEGVLHEFSSLPDVLEDVTDIILNLKEVLFRQFDPETKVLRISKTGPGKVTAGDIQLIEGIEVLNPDQHLATLGKDARFEAELIVSFGRGYVESEGRGKELPVGYIAVPALSSPIP